MNDLNQMFFQECDDLLEQLSSGLNDLEAGAGDEETVNSMFRAVHSMKGGAGAFGWINSSPSPTRSRTCSTTSAANGWWWATMSSTCC